ncbi:MAG: hypothetical protein KAS04_05745, partial [Candidatus Aenigmarchaeota archaeon]|nr:hypothetical protein [Candidatus Aenigmarchaeota archaeon]
MRVVQFISDSMLSDVGDLYIKRAAKIYGIKLVGENENIITTANRASVCNGLPLSVFSGKYITNIKASISDNSQIEFREYDGKLVDTRTGYTCKSSIKPEKEWSTEKTSTGRSVTSIIKDEFGDTVATTLFGCELKNIDKGCKFCSSPKYSVPFFSPEELKESLEISSSNENIGLIINTGSLIQGENGRITGKEFYSKIKPYIKVANMKSVKWVNLETMPSYDSKSQIRDLVNEMCDDGITSLQLNLELWDNNLRKVFMPYKGEIPKEFYYNLMDEWARKTGEWRTSSVLLAGIEKTESTRKGISELMKRGCIPSVEFFVPLRNTPLENLKADETIESLYEIKEMNRNIYGTINKNK